MTQREEWGPWIEHDDSGWPQGLEPDQVVLPQVGGDVLCPMTAISLDWNYPGDPVVRYRIRKPRGLSVLEDLIADVPAPQPDGVDA